MFLDSNQFASTRTAPSISSRTHLREELFTLYYTNGTSEAFYAKSIPAAIVIAKRKLHLPPMVSREKFAAAGGDHVLRNSTGERVYSQSQH